MRLLKIRATGLPLFDKVCEIDFVASQRVSCDDAEKMNLIFSKGSKKYYSSNVISFIGINASGKTTILKLISFVCKMLNNEGINHISCNEIIDGMQEDGEVVFDTYFNVEKYIYLLQTHIVKEKTGFAIKDEFLKVKSFDKVKNKADIFEFDDAKTVLVRNSNEAFLLDDVSIIVACNKKIKDPLFFTEMLEYTNINRLSISEDCPPELIAFFDPGVEYLHIRNNVKDVDICLKFKGKDEIVLNQFQELNRYLSSGTIKGINTFLKAIKTFEVGGYLIVDEIENHFNHEIVSTLIRFYFDEKVNSHGATLLFSTHYAEILDEFERNDNIYIVRNRKGITAENLSSILKRNDVKKSEAYESGLLEGTVPMYDAYIDLKKSIIHSRQEDRG